jgi:ethanolamine ammonia-lyase small subunit
MTHVPTIAGRFAHLTPARLRLEPSGGPAPLSSVLDLQQSHARAKDAIHQPVEWDVVEAALVPKPVITVSSRAEHRQTYLRRPDLGRRVKPADLDSLSAGAGDVALVLADGLSAHAVHDSGAAMVNALSMAFADLSMAPVVLVKQGRVGIGDEIAVTLGARIVVVLIGERPGLSVTNSLGAYITMNPAPGTLDSARNCVSNIHRTGGLSLKEAASRIDWLVRSALRLGRTGVDLKDESDDLNRSSLR